jgi:hypothetical protein
MRQKLVLVRRRGSDRHQRPSNTARPLGFPLLRVPLRATWGSLHVPLTWVCRWPGRQRRCPAAALRGRGVGAGRVIVPLTAGRDSGASGTGEMTGVASHQQWKNAVLRDGVPCFVQGHIRGALGTTHVHLMWVCRRLVGMTSISALITESARKQPASERIRSSRNSLNGHPPI